MLPGADTLLVVAGWALVTPVAGKAPRRAAAVPFAAALVLDAPARPWLVGAALAVLLSTRGTARRPLLWPSGVLGVVVVLTQRGLLADVATAAVIAALAPLPWRTWLRDVPVVRIAVALVMAAAASLPAPDARIAAATEPGLRIPPKRPGVTRVLFLGDGLAPSLAAGLRDADGVEVLDATGLTAGWPVAWADAVRAARPDVVALMADGCDRARMLAVLAGQRVVLLTTPYAPACPTRNDIAVVDLAAVLTTDTVNGVRVYDGSAITRQGARLLQAWLYRQVRARVKATPVTPV